MTSITGQKSDLKDILRRMMLTKYDDKEEKDRRILVESLLGQLMSRMSLRELRKWHQGIALANYVNDRIKERQSQ